MKDSAAEKCRLNRTRYLDFWNGLNWQLPDAVLATVWKVDRGNIRARRDRRGHPRPRWRLMTDRRNPVFQAAVTLEQLKARKFAGPKPYGTKSDRERGTPMKIPIEMSLEIIQRRDDGDVLIVLDIHLLELTGRRLVADVDAEDGLVRPRIIASSDTFGFDPLDRDVLATAATHQMLRYFGEGPTGGTIRWARWVEADLTNWLQQTLYRSTASRIARTFAAGLKPGTAGIDRSFTESLEV